jgi:putative transposase
MIEGIIKRLTLRRTPTIKRFACFSIEADAILPSQKEGPVMGIDVVLESFATLSNGEMIDNPRCFRSEEKELARVQRKLSKVPNGTPERKKAFKVVGVPTRGLIIEDWISSARLAVNL